MSDVRSYSTGTSFLNGGENKSVSIQSLPSPPASRPTSSHSGSNEDGEERGRSASTDEAMDGDKMGKDGKGNVIISVRVRPDQASTEAPKSDLEWMVDGRRSMIGYRGREGGEYNYGRLW
jgi:centromeric protein E